MNVWARVGVGAALGALATLLVHPISRARLFSTLWSWGPSPVDLRLPDVEQMHRLPEPKTLRDAHLWMQAGAQRILGRRPTTPREWDSFIQTARAGGVQQEDNALWPQMEAVFLLAKGDRPQAWKRWQDAAKRTRWDDGHSAKLTSLSQELVRAHGDAAWVYIPAYGRRTTEIARTIEWFTRDLVRATGVTTTRDLELRYATVMNGRLMREGGRSIQIGEIAMATTELGTYPPDLMSISSPRKLLIARAELTAALREQGWAFRADEVDRTFRENDGWLGFPNTQEAERFAHQVGAAVLIANALGLLAATTAVMGALLWGLGLLVRHVPNPERPRWIPVSMTAATAGVLAYLATDAWLPPLLLAASILSLAVSPGNVRRRAEVTLGYLHGMALVLTGIGLSVSLGLFALSQCTAGVESLPHLGWLSEVLTEHEVALSIAVYLLSVATGMSPAFAFVHRYSTLQIVGRSADRLGKAMMVGALVALIVGAPLALYVDRVLGRTLEQLVANEPIYYYVND